jgi:hypothetical protein
VCRVGWGEIDSVFCFPVLSGGTMCRVIAAEGRRRIFRDVLFKPRSELRPRRQIFGELLYLSELLLSLVLPRSSATVYLAPDDSIAACRR